MSTIKRLVPVVLVVGAALAGLAYVTWRRNHAPFRLSGTVEARDVSVGSLEGGRVLTVHVEEGAVVKAGDPIVTLEPDLLALQLREQHARVEEAEARLSALQAGPRAEEIERARAEWTNAAKERDRYATLAAQGVVSREAADQRATAEKTAHQQLLELQRGTRPEDVAAQQAVVAAAGEQLAYLERRQQETVVRAPVDARVQALDLRPGDIVAPDAPVADLVEDGQTFVRLYVPETAMGRVRVGQRVALTVDTFPDREFEGRIASVREKAEYTPRNVQTVSERGDQVFGIRVDVQAPELKAGMAVTARLLDDGEAPAAKAP